MREIWRVEPKKVRPIEEGNGKPKDFSRPRKQVELYTHKEEDRITRPNEETYKSVEKLIIMPDNSSQKDDSSQKDGKHSLLTYFKDSSRGIMRFMRKESDKTSINRGDQAEPNQKNLELPSDSEKPPNEKDAKHGLSKSEKKRLKKAATGFTTRVLEASLTAIYVDARKRLSSKFESNVIGWAAHYHAEKLVSKGEKVMEKASKQNRKKANKPPAQRHNNEH